MCDDRQGNRSRLEISIKVKKLLSPDAIPGKVIYLNDSEAKKIPLFLDKINYISNYENKPHAPFNQVPTIRFSQESESISPPWQEGNKGKKRKDLGQNKGKWMCRIRVRKGRKRTEKRMRYFISMCEFMRVAGKRQHSSANKEKGRKR